MANKKYQITVSKQGKYPTGEALLVPNTDNTNGYLWLGDENGKCIGWIDSRQLSAISEQWRRIKNNAVLRVTEPKRKAKAK